MQLQTYLMFDGNCEEAMSFYKSVLGGDFETVSYFKDGPMETPPGMENKIMHMDYRVGDIIIMGSDGLQGEPQNNRVHLSLSFDTTEEAQNIFDKLSENSKVTYPFEDSFWGSKFGMFTDQYGIHWMISAPLQKQ